LTWDLEPLARFERATYGLRRQDDAGIRDDRREASGRDPRREADPSASTRIVEGRAAGSGDKIAIKLLEAQSMWLRRQDAAELRRALLAILTRLEELS
jgi:hypothetical protein